MTRATRRTLLERGHQCRCAWCTATDEQLRSWTRCACCGAPVEPYDATDHMEVCAKCDRLLSTVEDRP